MEIDISKIVSAEELKLDLELIHSILCEKGEMIVFSNNQPQFVISAIDHTANKYKTNCDVKFDESEVKIGKYVQENMRKLFLTEALSENEIAVLTSVNYSNRVFNLNFPVLKEVNESLPFDDQKRDLKGYNRYYNFTLRAYGKQYLLCSQWVEYLHRDYFEKWLSNLTM